jgi:hypothetical protein
LSQRLAMLATKSDRETLKVDLIGEDAKSMNELRAYVRSRVSVYHPEEHLAD